MIRFLFIFKYKIYEKKGFLKKSDNYVKKKTKKKRKKEIEKLISKSIYLCLQEQH